MNLEFDFFVGLSLMLKVEAKLLLNKEIIESLVTIISTLTIHTLAASTVYIDSYEDLNESKGKICHNFYKPFTCNFGFIVS